MKWILTKSCDDVNWINGNHAQLCGWGQASVTKGSFVNNNPCEPEEFHILRNSILLKKYITNQFFPYIYQNVPVGSKGVKSMKHILN
jgi:hypothetical protein